MRARDTPAGTGAPPASFSGMLPSGNLLCSGLDRMTARAQRLQVFSAVISRGKWDDMVHQVSGGHLTLLGTMPA